ncbi:type VI secretion system lipoprotein TssJ [Trinickia sp.]|uniref:type VI secretion system lipoprotein TssJ n=1 Tax=Trinickia sp. TaxID=2571163 RepID=UPI003F8234E1
MTRARLASTIVSALLVASCASAPPVPAPPQARWTLAAASSINADEHGRPAPLVVRLYALSARDAFDRATFFELYDHDRTVLGQAALERSVLVLKPGEHVRFVRPLPADTRAFAVVAAYQRIDSTKWRAVVDVAPTVPPHDVNIAASFGSSAATLTLTPECAAGDAGNAVWKWIKPIWKKMAGLIGATG